VASSPTGRAGLLAGAALALALCGGCGSGGGGGEATGTHSSSETSACVRVPAAYTSRDLAQNGAALAIARGAVVFVALVEPERYATRGYPPGFPWQSPISSSATILAPVRICRAPLTFALAESVSAFRALRPGHATLAATLAPSWRSRARGLGDFRAVVTVVADRSAG
jgi:hypothetical protein